MKHLPTPPELRQWIDRRLDRRENILAVSNQGRVLQFRGEGQDLIVKSALGKGMVRRQRQRTLEREYQP